MKGRGGQAADGGPQRSRAIGYRRMAVAGACLLAIVAAVLTFRRLASPGETGRSPRDTTSGASGDARMLIEAGDAALREGRFEEALAFWRRAEPLAPADPDLQYGIGLALERLGRHDEAVRRYRQAMEGGARALDARLNLAGILAGQGQWQEAAEQYRAVLDRRPNDLDARLQLARVLVQLGYRQEAVRQYRRILQQAPGLPEAASELAEMQASRPG